MLFQVVFGCVVFLSCSPFSCRLGGASCFRSVSVVQVGFGCLGSVGYFGLCCLGCVGCFRLP